MRGLFIAVALFSAATLAQARDVREITPADLEPFVDGVVTTVMKERHVAGTVVGVVADGEVVLLKGYGYSDVENRVPVDPQTTMFRPGSVSKIFTWIALLQLLEQGKIDLDTDINTYLQGVQIPATYPEPVTITHLMTHTPGFEDHVLGLFGRDETSMRPLVDLLNEEMPLRVRPPGQYASYSNHGVAIAGLIVEQVSGEPWATYIDNHILEPLRMAHSTMRQPLPEHLAPHMSKGYEFVLGKYKERDFEYVPAAPAGSASASGADMLRLAQALLNGGAMGDVRILSEDSARKMQTVLFRPAEESTGVLHGMYESDSHGQRVIGHGGDTIWFHSELTLLPEQNVGWFISTNSAMGPMVRDAFHNRFLDRYFGESETPEIDFEKTDLSRLVGSYSFLRHSHSDFTKLILLLSAINVAATPEGQLMVNMGGEVAYLDEIAPLVFKREGGETTVVFDVDDKGIATHMYYSTMPVMALARLSGIDSPNFHLMIMVLSLLTFLWVLIVWTIQRVNRRWVLPRSVARFRLAAFWLSASVVLFVVWVAAASSSGPNDVVFGLPPALEFALVMPWIVMTLALVTVFLCPSVLKEEGVGILAKVGYVWVVAAGVAFTWALVYWQLL